MYRNILVCLCVLVAIGIAFGAAMQKAAIENSFRRPQPRGPLNRSERLILPITTLESPTICKCGQEIVKREAEDDDDVDFRIVGGQVAKPNEFPQMCQLLCGSSTGSKYFCGCTVINNEFVLTAAHCVTSPVETSSCNVTVGKHFLVGYYYEQNQKTIPVEKIIVHPNYVSQSWFFDDIAVLKLTEPLVFNQYVQPTCLPLKVKNYDNQIGIAAGWGRTQEGGAMSAELRAVDVQIITNTQCRETYKYQYPVQTSQICAGYPEGGKDACQGDSGGPLFSNSSDPLEQCGVVSNGYGCARPGQPGIFTRVGNYSDFIVSNTKVESGCQIYSYDTYP